jgi:hypothetical protein
MLDLSKLSKAPFRVCDSHGLCVVDPIGDVVCDLSVGQWTGNRTDAEFIALARNAFDVMMRRGWGVEQHSNGKWCIAQGTFKEDVKLWEWLCTVDHWANPFEALVEADRWHRENIEKGSE